MGSTRCARQWAAFLPLPAPKNAPAGLPMRGGPFAQAPFGAVMLSTMFALSDDQLALIMTAAGGLPVEMRSVLLEQLQTAN